MAPGTTHWTVYVQTFAALATAIGTFVYVYFTYHIMKWAIGQGKATVEVAQLTLSRHHFRRFAILAPLYQRLIETQAFVDGFWDGAITERVGVIDACMAEIDPLFEYGAREGEMSVEATRRLNAMRDAAVQLRHHITTDRDQLDNAFVDRQPTRFWNELAAAVEVCRDEVSLLLTVAGMSGEHVLHPKRGRETAATASRRS